MIIDSHVHIGKLMDFESSAEDVLECADEAGFDKIFVSHLSAIFYDFREGGNAVTAQAVHRYPERVLGYVAIPTGYFGQDALDELMGGIEVYGMRGLKIYSPPVSGLGSYQVLYSIDNPAMLPLIEKAAELKIPILAHATPQECEGVSTNVPEALLLMAHSAGQPCALGDWNRAIAAARQHPNIYLDTASSMVDMGYIEAAVETLGPERVIFGTDMPLLDPYTQLAKVTTAELDEEAKDLILGGNMARLLNLK
jgi:predicted TIM-barrel fold metal-dependent hydrolase